MLRIRKSLWFAVILNYVIDEFVYTVIAPFVI